ncbi:MAG: enterochelin esterase [Clostridia bacterium]|nr:enterochelin esterase [Clostridia bacterium]
MNIKGIVSPKIKELAEAVLQGNHEAINQFWRSIEKNGAPLIEAIPGDDKNVLVTVLWKDAGDIETISVFGELFGMNTEKTRLEKLHDTNLWYRTYKAAKNARSLYVFFINEKPEDELADLDIRLDPFNAHIVTCTEDEEYPNEYCIMFKQESMIELPGFEECPYVQEKLETPKGSIEKLTFDSAILGRSKRVWLYKPAHYDKLKKSCGLAVFFDGWEYLHETKAAVILDNMIAEGVIPPMVGVFIDNRDNRIEDLRLNTVFIDFIAEEIIPWIKGICNISKDPNDALIGGFSAGGLTAGYTAFLYPNIFGKVLSQSGAFYWGYNEDMTGAVLVDKFEQADKLPIELFMSLGEFEKFDYHLNAHLRLLEILKDKGYKAKFEEFMGGHTNFDCQITLSKGLHFLLGSR